MRYNLYLLFAALAALFGCQSRTTNKLDLKLATSLSKFQDVSQFKIDSIDWQERKSIYTILDSSIFYSVVQDSTIDYYTDHEYNVDVSFLYSTQVINGTFTLAVLTQFENSYCSNMNLLTYDSAGLQLDNVLIAQSCGDGGYWSQTYSKQISDSSFLQTTENNWETPEDWDNATSEIVSRKQSMVILKRDGHFKVQGLAE